MIFSKRWEYAIRALTHLARTRRVCNTRTICGAENVPYPFMAKVLQALTRRCLVRSVKGAGGGFVLAKPAHRVRLIDVLKAVDGDRMLDRCAYGLQRCSDTEPCPLHHDWQRVRSAIKAYLSSHTLAQLAAQSPPGGRPNRKAGATRALNP